MMKRTNNYYNKNRQNGQNGGQGGGQGGGQSGGQGGGQRQNYRKSGGNNHQHQHHDMGDGDSVHPRQRRHLQAQKDRYVAMARDALSRGDRILAEFYHQHVEHYTRMLNLIPEEKPQQQQQRPPRNHDQQQTQGANDQTPAGESSDAEDAEGDVPDETMHPGIGGGPSSFYQQPAQPAVAPVAPVDDADNY